MAKIYFMSMDKLKENSLVNENVADYLLLNAIYDAQKINLQSAIGSDLYDTFETLITTGDINLPANSNYKLVLNNEIVDVLVNWGLYYILPSVWVKIQNKSVLKQNSDNSTPVEKGDLAYIRNDVKYKADFYVLRLIDKLTELGLMSCLHNGTQSNIPTYNAGIVFERGTINYADRKIIENNLL